MKTTASWVSWNRSSCGPSKIKTKRAATKRFRTTKSGIVKRSKAYASHILTTKTRKRKRRLRLADTVNVADAKNIRKLIPYKF